MSPRPRRTAFVASVLLLLGAATLAGPAAPVVVAAPPPAPPRIAAVGDIACQSYSQSDGEGACRSDEVAQLITDLDVDAFLALGDLQYNNGKLSEYEKAYGPQFGHLLDITYPIPGNHEYGTEGAEGYYTFFGDRAHGPKGYYSFDLGTWHVVAINSAVCGDDPGCGPGSPQYRWLRADLRAHDDAVCTLAMEHDPVVDWRPWQKWVDPDATTNYGGSSVEDHLPMWELMDGLGVDALLVGDNHLYHRWAPQDVDGNRDPAGIRQFTVGTGGRSLYPLGKKPQPDNLLAVQNKAFGVLEMTLRPGAYDYRWVGLPTDPVFHDAGTFACR